MKKNSTLVLLTLIAVLSINLIGCSAINEALAERSFNQGIELEAGGQVDQALDAYNKAIEHNPSHAGAFFVRGKIRFDRDEYHLACEDLEKTAGLDPQNGKASYLAGQACLKQGEKDRAADNFSQALKINPKNMDACYQRGLIYLELGETENAFKDFTMAIQLGLQEANLYYQRGLLYVERGEQQNALDDLTKALQLDPEFTDAYYQRGLLYVAAGDHDGVIEDFSQYLGKESGAAELYLYRADAYWESGNMQAAVDDYKQVIDLDQKNALAHFRLGTYYTQSGNLKKSIDHFTGTIAVDEEHADAFFQRALAYYDSGELEMASADLETLRSLDSDYDQLYDWSIKVLLELEDYKTAIDVLDQAITANPDENRLVEQRGYAYLQFGDAKEASEDYLRLLRTDKSNYVSRYNLGLALALSSDLEGAIYQLTKVIENEPTAEAYYLRAQLFFEQFDLVSAIDDLEKTLVIDPQLHIVHMYLSQLDFLQGNLVSSIERAQDYLKTSPEDKLADQAQTWIYSLEAEMEGEPKLDLANAGLTMQELTGGWLDYSSEDLQKEAENFWVDETESVIRVFRYSSTTKLIEGVLLRSPTLESQLAFALYVASILTRHTDSLLALDNLGDYRVGYRESNMDTIMFKRCMIIVFMWITYRNIDDAGDFSYEMTYKMDECLIEALLNTLPYRMGIDSIQDLSAKAPK